MNNKAELERVFGCFDTDGDGKISPSELRQCVGMIGGAELLPAREAEAVVESLDSDGDGLLSLDDFVAMMESGEGKQEKAKDLREAFAIYDAEGRGVITPEGLRRMLSRLGDSKYSVPQCESMIKRFDLNGDGVISFDEFQLMMQ